MDQKSKTTEPFPLNDRQRAIVTDVGKHTFAVSPHEAGFVAIHNESLPLPGKKQPIMAGTGVTPLGAIADLITRMRAQTENGS